MGELLFVGAGLGDERDLSRRGLDALRACRLILAEEYTATLAPGSLDRLSAELGRPVRRLGRAEVEAETVVLEALAGEGTVAFLTAGDPFAGTTHLALRLAAERAGHRWRYLPGPSILTAAAGFLGLIHYRFGRIVSLPFPEAGFDPDSPFDRMRENRAQGLHTLVLLDLRPSEDRYLSARDALRLLGTERPGRPALDPTTHVAVVARVGRPSAQGWFGPLGRLATVDFGPPLHTLVLPAPDLHFEEREALRRYEVAAR